MTTNEIEEAIALTERIQQEHFNDGLHSEEYFALKTMLEAADRYKDLLNK